MTNYKTITFDKEHRHYGGTIYISDFNTDFRGKGSKNGSSIAKRIESDFKWERNLNKNRERNK